MPANPLPHDATQALDALASGRLGVRDLLDACAQRIERHNPRLNALVTLDLDRARQQADACDRWIALHGYPADRPLFGLPFSAKDAFASAGLRTTSSHPPLRDFMPPCDAALIARLKAAGGLLIGKSNLPELAASPQCWSPLFGATHNPWQPNCTPGGSSGGSAVAVAMGFSLLDLGSDLAGSIRIPAAYCGIVGFKASEGRIPGSGHIPPLPCTPRTVREQLAFGVLARSLADVQRCLPVLAGAEGIANGEQASTLESVKPIERPLRLAYWDDFCGLPLCARTRHALQRAIACLRVAGHEVERRWPDDLPVEACWRTFARLAGAGIGAGMPRMPRALLCLAGHLPGQHSLLARTFARAAGNSLRAHCEALDERERLAARLEEFLRDYDALLCPVAPLTAYPAPTRRQIGPPRALQIDGHRVPYLEATMGITCPFSLTGSPVVSLPAGLIDGLPVGLQIVGRRGQDEALLAVCQRIVGSNGWPKLPALEA